MWRYGNTLLCVLIFDILVYLVHIILLASYPRQDSPETVFQTIFLQSQFNEQSPNVQPIYVTQSVGYHQVIIGLQCARDTSRANIVTSLESVFKSISAADDPDKFGVIVLLDDSDETPARVFLDTLPNSNAEKHLEVIRVPSELHDLLGDGDMVREREVDTMDAVYLMSRAVPKSEYYMHIECGMSLAPDLLVETDKVINELDSSLWVAIDMGQDGISGCVFHSSELPTLSLHMLRHIDIGHMDQLLSTYIDNLYGNCKGRVIDGTCVQDLGLSRIQHHPALVTSEKEHSHHVIKSTGPRTPAGFEPYPWDDVPMFVNPDATVSSTMTMKGRHSIAETYALQGHYFVEAPRAGETIHFAFKTPVPLEEFYIRCWHPHHPGARFNTETFLDIQPLFPNLVTLPKDGYFKYRWTEDGYIVVGRADDRCNIEGPLGGGFGRIRSVRLRVTRDHDRDAVLREVVFKMLMVPSDRRPCCEPLWKDPFPGGFPNVNLYNE